MILKAIGAFVVACIFGPVIAGIITALAGVFMPEVALIAIPIVWILIMVMTR